LDVEVPSLAGASGGGKIGLRGRLLLAFAGISMFAVVAGLSGRYAFTEFTKALDRTEATIPPALAAVELTRESEQVLAAGPRLLNVQTSNERSRKCQKTRRPTPDHKPRIRRPRRLLINHIEAGR
jgi:hypothetical protein